MTKVILYTDGGARGNPGVAGAGVAILSEQGAVLKEASLPLGTKSNNQAEYEAVIFGLGELKKFLGKEKIKTAQVELRLDSELVAKQLRGEYQIKEAELQPLFLKIWNARVKDFKNLTVTYVPREQNGLADKLANRAMDEQQNLFGH